MTENPYIATLKVYAVIRSCRTQAQLDVATRMALRALKLFSHNLHSRLMAASSFQSRIYNKRYELKCGKGL